MLCGDGHCDSLGKNAKYCTYSLMESETNNILHMEMIDKREVNLKLPNIGREAFKRSMEYLISTGIKITEIVTDASTAVISTTGSYKFSYHLLLYFSIMKIFYPNNIHLAWMYDTNPKRSKGAC